MIGRNAGYLTYMHDPHTEHAEKEKSSLAIFVLWTLMIALHIHPR